MTSTIVCPVSGRVLFSTSELACPQTGEVHLADGFAKLLQVLRLDYGHPMKVGSCCRSASHNVAIGGHPNSLHVFDNPNRALKGAAAIDIHIGPGGAWACSRGRQPLFLHTSWWQS